MRRLRRATTFPEYKYLVSKPLRFLLCLCVSIPLSAHAAAPILYGQPFHQSPVRGVPDDLLLLAGHGFKASDSVVYQAIDTDSKAPVHPTEVPTEATGESGLAHVVSAHDVPNSLTVLLPESFRADRTYAFWVRTAKGEWSHPILLNDARPLWISPGFVYATAQTGSLPRYLKVVGRNLEPLSSSATQVRLVGPQVMMLQALENTHASLRHYVARVALPKTLAPGSYRVELSRDGTNWSEVTQQRLQVRSDPPRTQLYSPSDPAFGECHPNDQRDDTACIILAIEAARGANGATISLGEGTWDLIRSDKASADNSGITLPQDVHLVGAGAALTKIVRHPRWNTSRSAAFTLVGNNRIAGLTFHDAQVFSSPGQAGPFLRLGKTNEKAPTDIVISDNVFDRTIIGIADAGLPIERLFITHNEFGSFHEGIRLDGNRFNTNSEFNVVDSVIAYNSFKPGSLLAIETRQGAIASEIGAGYRVDFSDNYADGATTDYLNSPEDARGWRAAFFWHMNNNQEMLLVSNNIATCTGDKIGDGEAFSYDNNGNTFGFDSAGLVVGAKHDSIIVSGTLLTRQNGREVPLASYYAGHWIQIGEGRGIGQVRKIKSYTVDTDNDRVTFKVSPAWDVVPDPGSTRVSVGREFWQVYTIANTVDHRQPLCIKSNRSDPKGGVISLWAQTADSVVEGNRQFDTDGILFQNKYSGRSPNCAKCDRGTNYINFVEIRNNLIDGEYDWNDDCSSSGILGSLAAAPGSAPLTVSYGVSIAHNTIRHADARRGGAIAFTPTWFTGPAPHQWPLVNSVLIHHNTLERLWDSAARACGNAKEQLRTGISLGGSRLVWRPIAYANACGSVPLTMTLDGTQQPIRYCKGSMVDACECAMSNPAGPKQ